MTHQPILGAAAEYLSAFMKITLSNGGTLEYRRQLCETHQLIDPYYEHGFWWEKPPEPDTLDRDVMADYVQSLERE